MHRWSCRWMTACVWVVCVAWGESSFAQDEPKRAAESAQPKAKSDELPSDASAEEALLKLAGEGFKLKRTPHYVIAYDTDEATLKAFVNRVEPTYRSVTGFAARLGFKVKPPKRKLEILFFNQFADYDRYSRGMGFPGSQEAPGFYAQTTNRSAFFNYGNSDMLKRLREDVAQKKAEGQLAARSGARLDFQPLRAAESRAKRQEERINCVVVQHEVAHQVFFNIGFHAGMIQANPRWFVEGLAMMFETPPTGGGAGIGAVNQMRLGDWKGLRDKHALLPIETLVTDPMQIVPTNPNAARAYAQAWSLVHYLQRTKPKQFLAYVKAIRQRKGEEIRSAAEEKRTFEEAFGPIDAAFVEKYEAFIGKIEYKPIESGM